MSVPNQPPLQEVKELALKKPLYFPTLEFSRRYTPQIPLQSTLDPTYTSLPKTPDPHQDSSLNEELQGVTSEEPLYRIHNTEIDQLHHHTQAYLKSICQIPIIYPIPRSRVSQKITQPFGENENLTPSIDNLIIDTILDIQQPIATISHSET